MRASCFAALSTSLLVCINLLKGIRHETPRLAVLKSKDDTWPSCACRYFEADKNGADASLLDLKPGVLSADLRAALGGLASTDPPPWLHRMRALGYPPGYM